MSNDICFCCMFLFDPLKCHISSLRRDLGLPFFLGGGYDISLLALSFCWKELLKAPASSRHEENHRSLVEDAINRLKLKYMAVFVYSQTLASRKEHIHGSVPIPNPSSVLQL